MSRDGQREWEPPYSISILTALACVRECVCASLISTLFLTIHIFWDCYIFEQFEKLDKIKYYEVFQMNWNLKDEPQITDDNTGILPESPSQRVGQVRLNWIKLFITITDSKCFPLEHELILFNLKPFKCESPRALARMTEETLRKVV